MGNSVEKIEQEIDMSNDPVEIEIIDDTPEADRKPKRDENVESKIPDDDEVAKYGTDVQKRIKQLKYEYHEERRQKEEAIEMNKQTDLPLEQARNIIKNKQRGTIARIENTLEELKEKLDRSF